MKLNSFEKRLSIIWLKNLLTEEMEEDMRELKIEKQDLSSSDKLLIEKSIKGISWRYKDISEEKITRLEHELNTIINMGFPDYFLIVQDFLDVGRRIGYMPDDRIIYLKEHCYGPMS